MSVHRVLEDAKEGTGTLELEVKAGASMGVLGIHLLKKEPELLTAEPPLQPLILPVLTSLQSS